jgi:hypothetical protein
VTGLDSDQERKNRITRNETIFRAVNERVNEMQEERVPDVTDFLCECGNAQCVETISLTAGEYEGVRVDARWFAVLPGHVVEDVERVVEKRDRFFVVQKNEEERAIAKITDPRS